MDRRTFLSLAAAAALPRPGWAQGSANGVALYAAVGPVLTHYEVDVAGLALTPRGSVTLPANVQYVWPHRLRRHLYAATSPGTGSPGPHHVSAFRIDAGGALTPHGNPIPIPTRPIHITSDPASEHVLVAFNLPSALRVYRINADATLGSEVRQPGTLDFGIYAHQVRMAPNGRFAVLVARGNDAAAGKPEDPGSLKTFSYAKGLLGNEKSIAPNGGLGFGPRHVDFHPSRPWMYVSLERQNQMYMYRLDGDAIAPEAAFKKDTLSKPAPESVHQYAGTVHVHPNGRTLYGVNRADTTIDFQGQKVFAGGENTLAVYAINQSTGEPVPIQHIETGAIHCRCFHIDPSGRMLVAAHNVPMVVRDGSGVKTVPACLSIFRIADDGKLTFVRKLDVDTRGQVMFWMGMVPLEGRQA
jgi:6-phosphogluconolactonase (cycloisomerase 2 family)